jgi:hypothetical protein
MGASLKTKLKNNTLPLGRWNSESHQTLWCFDFIPSGFCGFLLFLSSFHFVLIKFTMGSPTCFKWDLTLTHILCPTSSSWNWGQTLDLHVWGEHFCIRGVSKVWSIVQDGQIKETHAKLNFELEMHQEQTNKHQTKYGILVSLANEKTQTSTHILVSLQKHPHIVSVVI